MHSITVLSFAIVALSSCVSASPIEARQAPDRFYLQTKVVPGVADSGTDKNGLYVYSYHTGAGLGAATVSAGQPTSWFYLNDTNLLWTYENNTIGPWPVSLVYGPYQAFNPISISIASNGPTPGFSVNSTGLQLIDNNGWLACDWWYTDPQLFALNGDRSGPLPTSCSKVDLVAVPAA